MTPIPTGAIYNHVGQGTDLGGVNTRGPISLAGNATTVRGDKSDATTGNSTSERERWTGRDADGNRSASPVLAYPLPGQEASDPERVLSTKARQTRGLVRYVYANDEFQNQ